jgi:hypothetical protein
MFNATVLATAVRVVLAGVPGLTAELVRQSVFGQSDICIVAELRAAEEVTAFAAGLTLVVVVTARSSDGVPSACQQLLFGVEAIPVIVIAHDGRLEIYDRRVLREAALDDLPNEIRRLGARLSEHRS